MAKELRTINYIDYKVYNVTNIKNKYGFMFILTLDDNSKRSIQHSGCIKKDIAEKERYKVKNLVKKGSGKRKYKMKNRNEN